jgi:SAM-dependent methyltransferase
MNIHHVFGVISPIFRRRRMRRFLEIIDPRPGEALLDIGGTPWFWIGSGVKSRITLLNIRPLEPQSEIGDGLAQLKGDGCSLPFGDASFDIVFSNSVIEHVGAWERQQAFAREALRAGRRIWVQTPAREFIIEPHLISPFIHWLPRRIQRKLIRNFTLRGWIDRPDKRAVEEFLDEVRLLSLPEMKLLFPGCVIQCERFLGMNKSYIAVRT